LILDPAGPAGSGRFKLYFLAIAAALVTSGALGYLLLFGHQEARRSAAAAAGNQVLAIESRFGALLRRADDALVHVDAAMAPQALQAGMADRNRSQVVALLDREVGHISALLGLEITDGAGRPIYWSGATAEPILGAVPGQCLMPAGQGIRTGVAAAAGGGGMPILALCRRLQGADGKPAGYAVALVNSHALDETVSVLDLGTDGVAEIRRSEDFGLIVRWPEKTDTGDRADTDRQTRQRAFDAGQSGSADIDGPGRSSELVAFRGVDGFPFVVSVAVSQQQVLGGWMLHMALLAVVVVALLVLAWTLRSRARDLGAEAGVSRRLRDQAERLQVSEFQLGEAMDMARMAYWEFRVHEESFELNDRLLALLRIDSAHLGGHVLSADDFVARLARPDDGAALRQDLAQCLATREPKRVFARELRLRCGDGSQRWFGMRFHYLPPANGRAARILGAVLDIDDSRRAEDRLRLLANVFEFSGEAIVVTDADNNIVSVNRAFARLTGYQFDEVRGRNPRVLSAGRMAPDGYRTMWRSIIDKGSWEGEIWDRRKDGSCYPKWLTISTLKDDAGKVTHYIGSFTDISERKLAEERIYHLAHHDALTGLPNRFSLHDRLSQAVVSARRETRLLAVMFLDLDHFKAINDSLGHPVGDRLLIEVAHRLKACVRESDVVARLGGDEFVVVMTDVGEPAIGVVSVMAAKIMQRLTQSHVIDGHDLHATPSIGIAVFPNDGDDADTLMKNADVAMYHAKARGRRNFQFFAASMNEAAAERVELEGSLRQAIDGNEMLLHFQPQVDSISGRVVGVEALVRWQHPSRGMIPPAKFIPLAEETGLIEPLGRWVLDAACRQLQKLAQQGRQNVRMGVNLSARQLREGDLVDYVRELLATYRLQPGDLELEITESTAMENADTTIGILRRLRELGVALAIDDFGTGYSSLAYLKLLPIQRLKLDRSFVRDIETDHNDAIICSATIALAHSLGLEVVAEGVETEAQLTYLKYLGCDLIQGYYFSKPLPGDELTAFLDRQPAAE
jgi:diguanylate cyclase (GGDEF)-like protein/PAS domain S-box-containing protein